MPLPPLVEPVAELSEAEQARTARHAVLVPLGEIGQRRLAAAHVAVMGAGGLGSPLVYALAAAGVGTLTVIDDDTVTASNLQRQVMHRISDIGRPKVDSAVRVAREISPETRVIAIRERLTDENADRLLAGADLVLDGTDLFETRELVAASCERTGTPLVWGTVQEFDAQVTVFWSAPPADHDPVRLADLYPPDTAGELPSCAEVGVLGAMCLQIGSLMATEAVKLITGIGEPLLGRVLVIDALRSRQQEVPLRPAVTRVSPSKSAPSNSQDATPRQALAAAESSGRPEPVQNDSIGRIAPRALAESLTAHDAPLVLDVREPSEHQSGRIADALTLPLGELLRDPAAVRERLTSTSSAGTIVLVCELGPRADRAAQALAAYGLYGHTLRILDGGMAAWRTAGLPMRAEPSAATPAAATTPTTTP